MNDTGKPFPTEPYVRQAACRVVTICQVIIQHMVNFRQPVPTPGRTQVFAAPLDYCKATKPIKQQAAGRTPPPVVLRIATPCYLQAGAPSETAIPAGSAASLTKMAHVTDEPPVRLLFVIDASQPPPATLSVTRLLPVVGHQLTCPAAGVRATPPTLLVTLVLYLTESAKNASSAVTRLRRSDFIEAM